MQVTDLFEGNQEPVRRIRINAHPNDNSPGGVVLRSPTVGQTYFMTDLLFHVGPYHVLKLGAPLLGGRSYFAKSTMVFQWSSSCSGVLTVFRVDETPVSVPYSSDCWADMIPMLMPGRFPPPGPLMDFPTRSKTSDGFDVGDVHIGFSDRRDQPPSVSVSGVPVPGVWERQMYRCLTMGFTFYPYPDYSGSQPPLVMDLGLGVKEPSVGNIGLTMSAPAHSAVGYGTQWTVVAVVPVAGGSTQPPRGPMKFGSGRPRGTPSDTEECGPWESVEARAVATIVTEWTPPTK